MGGKKITQLELTQFKKFERKLNSFERRFFRSPNQTISIVARVKGYISEENFGNALNKVRQQHPLLGVRIYMGDNEEPWYTNDSVPENPLKVIQRTSEEDWNRELVNDYKNRFKLSTGPLARFILLQSQDISELLIVCHHVICDGTSLAILARDLLLYIGNPNQKAPEILEPPLATPDNFPIDVKIGKAIRFAIKKMNDLWQKKKIIFDEEDEDNIFKAFWDNYHFHIISVELSEEQTSKLVESCSKHGITVNSALNTSFLAARNSVLGPFKGGRQNVLIPVNTRNLYKNPIGESVGVYVSGFDFKFSYNPKKGFWENAKIFNDKAKENLYIKKIFEFAVITDLVDQTMVDARQFSLLGKLVPSTFSRYEKIHTYSTDEKNIANKRAKKQIPKFPGLAITNLGRLDYPEKYGTLELERFILVTSGTPYIELVIPVVTIAGKLSFTINYLEEITDTPTMGQIKNETLEYLDVVED
ncbi:MAG: condensation domain-containing protein [Promethearchaeota archaeon]